MAFHMENDLVLLAAIGIDGEGVKHPLGVLEGATENAAVVQALLDNLVDRGLDPKVCRLFIIRRIEGTAQGESAGRSAKAYANTALSGAQGTQHHGASAEAPACLGAAGRYARRGELDDATKAEQLIRQSRAAFGAGGAGAFRQQSWRGWTSC